MLITTSAISLFVFLMLITTGGRTGIACGFLAVGLIALFTYVSLLSSRKQAMPCDHDPRSQRRKSCLLKR